MVIQYFFVLYAILDATFFRFSKPSSILAGSVPIETVILNVRSAISKETNQTHLDSIQV